MVSHAQSSQSDKSLQYLKIGRLVDSIEPYHGNDLPDMSGFFLKIESRDKGSSNNVILFFSEFSFIHQ